MAFTKMTAAIAATVLSFAPAALAGFESTSQSNLAVYWGQNSAGTATSQERLSTYCADTDLDIIPLSFMTGLATPAMNFANANDNCTAIAGGSLLDCPQLEEDITSCQEDFGKTIILSLGGATYAEGGFTDEATATASADTIWSLFGSDTSGADRPFGSAVVDGFDFDFESTFSNGVAFARQLRSNMDAAGDKTYYLTAAPQCVYPDANVGEMLASDVPFDIVMVQFYNNACGVNTFVSGSDSQATFNLEQWNTWATGSANPDVKVLVGAPASTAAAGSGYVEAATLVEIHQYATQFSNYGGVMLWDVSQMEANAGFEETLVAGLGSAGNATSTF